MGVTNEIDGFIFVRKNQL